MKFLSVVIRFGLLYLLLDLGNSALYIRLRALSFDDGSVFLCDDDLLRLAQHGQVHTLQFETKVLGYEFPARQDCKILHHRLASVTEARCFHCDRVHSASQLVHDQSRQCFAFDVFCHNQEGLSDANDLFQRRYQIGDSGNLLLKQKDVRFFKNGFHPFGIGHHVGRDVTFVELHSFDELQACPRTFGLLDCDNTVPADLFHSFGDEFAYRRIICGDGGDLRDLCAILDGLALLLDLLNRDVDRFFYPVLDQHGVGAGSDVLQTLSDYRLRQDGGSGCSIASHVVRFRCHFPGQLGTHVLEAILDLDLLCYRYTVIDDRWRSK